MRSVSRHLDPPQADLDNGSVVLQHLTLSVSVCVCAEWSFVWPGLLCHLARSLERQAQAICSLSHCHHTDAVIVKVPHLTDLSAPLLELCFPFQPLEGMYAGSLANCAFSCSCSLLLCRMIKSKYVDSNPIGPSSPEWEHVCMEASSKWDVLKMSSLIPESNQKIKGSWTWT